LIRVAIVEDEPGIREGLRILIDGAEGFSCAAAFGTAEDALRAIGANLPDVVLMDIGLPGTSGIQATRLLRDRFPNLLVVVLTVYGDDQRIFDAICAGASGYLLKKTAPAHLLESIRDAVNGGAPMSPEVAGRVIQFFRQFRPASPVMHDLTPHEMRLLKLLVEGHNYKSASLELGVSINTVSFHMKHIYEKLHVHSKSEAVAKALRNRILGNI
jgi:DNA-binding NarL/FixJ family response regulator